MTRLVFSKPVGFAGRAPHCFSSLIGSHGDASYFLARKSPDPISGLVVGLPPPVAQHLVGGGGCWVVFLGVWGFFFWGGVLFVVVLVWVGWLGGFCWFWCGFVVVVWGLVGPASFFWYAAYSNAT